MNLPDKVNAYLNRFGTAKWQIEPTVNRKYKIVIVVPALDELQNVPKLIESLNENNEKLLEQSLLLFVVNNSGDYSGLFREENEKTINLLREYSNNNQLKVNVAFVDASSPGRELPSKHAGVGLARKIGLDRGLTVFDYDKPGKNILICLDADCLVDTNYLSEIEKAFNIDGIDAGTVRFAHQPAKNELHQKAILCYEIFLRYYLLGLRYAGSPFDYLSVGSTIVCDHEAYISVQGMNKRKGGEDFYFLEKLAKHYEIARINSTTVYPSARESDRVPFGTGKRVGKFRDNDPKEYEVYSPQIFHVLKEWNYLFFNSTKFNEGNFLLKTQEINKNLYEFLIHNQFEKNIRKIIANSKTVDQLNYQKKNWFDAFRTLKLIHHLRDNEFPNENLFGSVDEILKKMNFQNQFHRSEEIPSIDIQKKYLKSLRDLT